MTFRVMAGFSAIWAGKARELKDGSITMPGERHEVTEDVLAAAAIWLDGRQEDYIVCLPDRKITLKTITEYRKEAKE